MEPEVLPVEEGSSIIFKECTVRGYAQDKTPERIVSQGRYGMVDIGDLIGKSVICRVYQSQDFYRECLIADNHFSQILG